MGSGFRLLPLHSALLLPPHHKQLDVSKSQHNSKGMNKITLGGGFAVSEAGVMQLALKVSLVISSTLDSL